ncbi:1117_t:CDS:2, partial [Racocetra fulgida]
LLQSPAADLKPPLVFIWARILAVDRSCQQDLLKEHGYNYFVNILSPNSMLNIPNEAEHRAMCAFILAIFCTNFNQGQVACKKALVLQACLARIGDVDALLRQWACLCIGQYWTNYADAKSEGIENQAHLKLFGLLNDPVPEVRASALYALGTFIGDLERTEQIVNIEHNIAINALDANNDASPLVRRELVIALSYIVNAYSEHFIRVAYEELQEIHRRVVATRQRPRESRPSSVYTCVWKALLNLSADPDAEVAQLAATVVDAINTQLLESSHIENVTIALRQVLQEQGTQDTESFRASLNKQPSYDDILPLKSKFFDWSCEYFREPQMKPAESEQSGSIDDNVRSWRRKRNENIIKSTQPLKEVAGDLTSWRAMPEILPNSQRSGLIAEWQQSRGTLLVGGDVRVIRVWDALREITVSVIPARSGSSITSLTSDGDLFVAGFADGAIRIFDIRIQPIDAMILSNKEHKNSITNVVWQKGAGHELVSGSKSGEIKIWDIRHNRSKRTISNEPNSCEMNAMDVHQYADVIAR